MPINFDGLDAVYSNLSFRAVINGVLSSRKLIDKLDDLLTNHAGWTRTGQAFASGTVSYPLGAPTYDGNSGIHHAVFCSDRAPFLVLSGLTYKYYNPGTEDPIPGTCVWFAMSTTSLGTISNLAAAISGSSVYTGGTIASPLQLVITAAQPGPDLNFPQLIADGGFGAGNNIDGGGWKWTSIAGYDVLAIGRKGGWDATDGWTVFTFTLNGTDIVGYKIDTATASDDTPISQITIVANPYGFTLFDPQDDNHRIASTSMLITSLNIPSDFQSVTPAIFALGAGAFRNSTDWYRNTFDNVFSNGAILCLGQAPNRIPGMASGSGSYPRPMCLRSPGTAPLTSNAGVPIIQGAYIMMGVNQLDSCYVVGRMYDCVMVTDYMPGPIETPNPNDTTHPFKFESISAQPGLGNTTKSSLMWRYVDA